MSKIIKLISTLEVDDKSEENLLLFINETKERIKNKERVPLRDSWNRQRYDKGLLGNTINIEIQNE